MMVMTRTTRLVLLNMYFVLGNLSLFVILIMLIIIFYIILILLVALFH